MTFPRGHGAPLIVSMAELNKVLWGVGDTRQAQQYVPPRPAPRFDSYEDRLSAALKSTASRLVRIDVAGGDVTYFVGIENPRRRSQRFVKIEARTLS